MLPVTSDVYLCMRPFPPLSHYEKVCPFPPLPLSLLPFSTSLSVSLPLSLSISPLSLPLSPSISLFSLSPSPSLSLPLYLSTSLPPLSLSLLNRELDYCFHSGRWMVVIFQEPERVRGNIATKHSNSLLHVCCLSLLFSHKTCVPSIVYNTMYTCFNYFSLSFFLLKTVLVYVTFVRSLCSVHISSFFLTGLQPTLAALCTVR